MRILITGANGFIGTHVARQLLDAGHTVRGLIRPGASDPNVALLREWGVEVVENTDEANPCEGIEGIVHLIGSIRRPKETTFVQMHEGETSRLIEHADEAGVKRFVYISAPGAIETAKSEYLRTKWLAEDAIRDEEFEHVILRTSLVVGRRIGHRDSKLMRRLFTMAREKKKMPVLGDGSHTLQPIHVANLAEAIEQALTRPDLANQTLNLGGPETLTMDQIVTAILRAAGHPEKPLKHVPLGLAKLLAPILQALMSDPPIEKAQVLAMEETEPIDFTKVQAAFPGVGFIRFEEALIDYA